MGPLVNGAVCEQHQGYGNQPGKRLQEKLSLSHSDRVACRMDFPRRCPRSQPRSQVSSAPIQLFSKRRIPDEVGQSISSPVSW